MYENCKLYYTISYVMYDNCKLYSFIQRCCFHEALYYKKLLSCLPLGFFVVHSIMYSISLFNL